MQLVTNERLLKRETVIGMTLLIIPMLVLGVGFVVSNDPTRWDREDPRLPLITFGSMMLALVVYFVGQTRIRRYGANYRQDRTLRQLLKALDDRHVLFAFLSRRLPDYVLVGPNGVTALIARGHDGQVVSRDNTWKRTGGRGLPIFRTFYGTPIGNPSWDAQQAAARLETFLSSKLGDVADVPVRSLIVFTNPGIRLRIERSRYTVTTARELRNVVKKIKPALSQARLGAVVSAFQQSL